MISKKRLYFVKWYMKILKLRRWYAGMKKIENHIGLVTISETCKILIQYDKSFK